MVKKEISIDKNLQKQGDSLPGVPKDVKQLDAALKNIDEAIDHHGRRLKVTKDQFNLMIESPEPLDPKFAYEEREEWIEVAREFHILSCEAKLKEIGFEISGLEERKKTFEDLKNQDLTTDTEEKLKK